MQENVFVIECKRIGKRKAYHLKFPYNEQIIKRIKELPEDGRKWDKPLLAWELTSSALLKLIKQYKSSAKIFFDFGNEKNRNDFKDQIKKIEKEEKQQQENILQLEVNIKKWLAFKTDVELCWEKYSAKVHSFLKDGVKLRPYQVAGVMYLSEVKNAILGLDMGLGKSLISISFLELCGFNKIFVITPNSLKHNYKNEIEKFTNSKAHVIGYKKNLYSIEEAKYIIVNYEYFNSSNFKKTEAKFKKLNIGKIDCLICDESHRLGNSSNTFKNFKKIFKESVFSNGSVSKIFMSGTPANSKVTQLYNVLNQICPLEFTTKKYFYEYYCGMTYNKDGYGWEFNENHTNYEELYNKISPFIFRKKKIDVLKDLPPITFQKVVLEMSDEEYKTYYEIEEGVANEFTNGKVVNPLAIMMKLKQYTSFLKIKYVSEMIDTVLEMDEKFVVIDFFKENLKEISKQYSEISVLHTGDIKDSGVRAKMVADFENLSSNIKLFLASSSTSKEGLTLVAASKLLLMTIPWVYSEIDQIASRIYRIGQVKPVNIYIPMVKNSIDSYILGIAERGQNELSQVIDGEKYKSSFNESMAGELIEIIKEKHRIGK